MLLSGKTVFVTGAGRGIGREIASAALREEAEVIAHVGRQAETSHGSARFDPAKTLVLHGDISRRSEIDRLWADAVSWRGRVDVLVNNAGVYAASPLNNFDDWRTGWETNLAINLEAPAHFCRYAIEHFQQTKEGIIINIASRSSHRGDDAEHFAYGAAKGGLLALTKGIARSYATTRTLAYAVAPAWVRTEMAEAHIAEFGEAELAKALPMREITPASDVAETVIFLASGRARHATGSTIDITGADYVR